MDVTVIIPNYNGSYTISKCIESIYNQDISIRQLIVVDDNSTDDSVDILNKMFPSVEIICLGSNGGAAKARNIGIKEAKGDLILLVDSDVYLSNDCLRQMMDSIIDSDIVYPRVLYEDGTVLSPASPNEKRFIRRSPIFLIKMQALFLLDELFDEEYFIYFEDIDFFMRCCLANLQSKYIDSAIAYHSIAPQERNLELRFYLETRNRIYCFIKFLCVSGYRKREFLLPNLHTLFETILTMWSKRNIYLKYPDHRHNNQLSDSRIRLIILFWKAIFWNIKKLPVSLRKQQEIRRRFPMH